MICDDSALARAALSNMLSGDAEIEVIAKVANGRDAIDTLKRHHVDVLLLDIEMPVMDGLTALPHILAAAPEIAVIMVSTRSPQSANGSIEALGLAASDYLLKPTAALTGNQQFQKALLAKVHGFGRRRDTQAGSPSPSAFVLRPLPTLLPRLLAIGSSTGGPNALFALIKQLSPKLQVPVVITQHMPAEFTPSLAEHIARLGVLPCTEAKEGDAVLPGRVLLAPGARHMLVRRQGVSLVAHLSDTPPENSCRPSVDAMLRSASAAMNGRVLVAMLTGMGCDGLLGSQIVVDAGGALVAQDEASSVVWGMPGAVVKAGLAHAVLPLSQIGAKLQAMIGGRSAVAGVPR